MEHIVQFGISIDDERIQKSIEEQAVKMVFAKVMENIGKSLPTIYSRWSGKTEVDWPEFSKQCGKDFLEANRDEIINGTIEKLTASIRNSKKFKEQWETAQKEL